MDILLKKARWPWEKLLLQRLIPQQPKGQGSTFTFFIEATGECSPLIYHSSKQRNREPSLNSLSSLRLVFRDFLFDSDLFQWPLVASITWCLLLVGKWRRALHRTCLTCLKLKCRPWKDYILLVYRDNLRSLWRLASDIAWMIQKSLEREITHEF